MRWVGHVVCMGEMRKEYRFLIGKPKGMRLLWRTRCKWEDNIKINPQDLGF
jgi:hypothetical protein